MHFENEKLDSINADKEFEITLRGMLAQDYSRNTSENIQWGFQRKFEKGDIFTKYKNFMGYTCVDSEIVIVPEQAEVVRKIFDLYLQGLSLRQIKSYLESQGIKTVTGKDDWNAKTIRDMLMNEKYKGDTLLQKTFTEDFVTGKKSKNDGQRNRYYVKDSHPASVSSEVFDKVQEEEEGISVLQRLPISSTQNIILADKLGDMAVAECSPHMFIVRKPESNNQFLVSSNHFVDEKMQNEHGNPEANWYQSFDRYSTVYNALSEKQDEISANDAMDVLGGKYGFTCQYKKGLDFDTIWSVVYDLTAMKTYCAEGNPSKTEFKEDTRLSWGMSKK